MYTFEKISNRILESNTCELFTSILCLYFKAFVCLSDQFFLLYEIKYFVFIVSNICESCHDTLGDVCTEKAGDVKRSITQQ